MNEQFSESARSALGLLTEGMTPSAAEQANAWARLEDKIGQAQYAEEFTFRRRVRRGFRYVRGYLRTMWMPLAIVTIAALMIGQIIGGESGTSAHIPMAQAAIERGDYREAYNLLAEHSRIYHTKRAAEQRMGLVLDALCGLKMYDKAEDDLERYLELNPDSEHAYRASDLCPAREARED